MLKVGVIGGGSISEFHIKPYMKNDGVELVALCDNNERRLAAVGERYRITTLYRDYEELLRNPEIDAVSICSGIIPMQRSRLQHWKQESMFWLRSRYL